MIKILKSLFKSNNTEEKSQKTDKKNFDILKYDGLRAQRMGRADYAVKCFENALKIEEEFETMGYLTQLYLGFNRPDDAQNLLRRMAEMEPDVAETFMALANVCYTQEQYAHAIEAGERAIALSPENAQAYYLMAKILWKTERSREAVEQLNIAIGKKNDFAEAVLLRAEIHLGMKQFEDAEKDITALLALNPEEEHAQLLYGKLKQATGHEDEAEKAFQQVIELNPFNEQAYIDLAGLFIAQKHLDKAITLLDEAVELNPGSPEAYRQRGKAKLLNGDKEGAREDEQEYLRLATAPAEQHTTPAATASNSGSGVLGGL